ncbi:hypothetical protein V6Z12_D08G218400 [Gossypium hirsutum]
MINSLVFLVVVEPLILNIESKSQQVKEYRLDQTPCVWLQNNLWPMDGLLSKKQDVFTGVYSFKLLITRAE